MSFSNRSAERSAPAILTHQSDELFLAPEVNEDSMAVLARMFEGLSSVQEMNPYDSDGDEDDPLDASEELFTENQARILDHLESILQVSDHLQEEEGEGGEEQVFFSFCYCFSSLFFAC